MEVNSIVTKELLNCLNLGEEIAINIDSDRAVYLEISKEIKDKEFNPDTSAAVYKGFRGFDCKVDYDLKKHFKYANFYFSLNNKHIDSRNSIWDILVKIIKIGDKLTFKICREELTYSKCKYQADCIRDGQTVIYPLIKENLLLSISRKDKPIISNLLLFSEKVIDNDYNRKIKIKEEKKQELQLAA